MKVVVDAMGGDRAPQVVVEGAVQAAEAGAGSLELFLVGDETLVRDSLSQFSWQDLPIRLVHAADTVGAHDLPGQAVRRKGTLP